MKQHSSAQLTVAEPSLLPLLHLLVQDDDPWGAPCARSQAEQGALDTDSVNPIPVMW
jgi:hypothetical protein